MLLKKENKLNIEGGKIYLKNITENNATKEYCGWLNDIEVNKYLTTRKTNISELKKYINNNNLNKNCLFLGIFYKENDKHIGNIKLEPIDYKNKKAMVGILIGDKNYWGVGAGTEALKLLVNYAFKELELKKISLGVISDNKAAIRAYEKAGFRVNKIEKNWVRGDKKVFTRIIMSIENNYV